jgi:glycosyltransferase involved in cell wall biosynthesis
MIAAPRQPALATRTDAALRVLHLYAGNMFGGIERLLITLAAERRLCPGMAPAFGLCFPGRLSEELLAAGVPVHDLGPVRLSRPWTVWRARRRLRRLLTRERFDVVVAHAAWPHAVFARAVRAANTPLATWVHDSLTGRGDRIEAWAARTPPDLAIANSSYTAASVPNVFSGVQTDVIYLPVAPPPPAPADRLAVRGELDTPTGDVVIVQACRLERWKGHAVLVEALGQLHDLPGWTAWIAGGPQKGGDAEYLAELRSRAAELRIAERVRFLGQRQDVARLLGAADVLCQPNTGPEPFGIAFVEALHAGLPVVTSDIGGGREVVDARCGVLTPPNNPRGVAEALRELIACPTRRRELGQAGPARAAELCDPARQMTALALALQGVRA